MASLADYTKRLLGYLGDRDPLEVMAATPGALRALVEHFPSSALHASPAPGKWSIGQIVAHLADGEVVFGYRVRRMLASSGSPITAYDQDQWAAALKYDQIPAQLSLQRLTASREWTVALVGGLTEEEWERYGVHEERGRESVRDLTRLYAGHDLNHTQQIERILAASGR